MPIPSSKGEKTNESGQIVLLAGATGGIGASIVRYLSEAGATIAIQYHRHKEKAEELQESAGNDSQVFQANLDDLTQTEHLFQEVITAYGRVDTLINSAGIYLPFQLDKGTGNGWRTGRG
ncbi:MAG: SDR family NAD(P)-dependent oxidoreductase [Deltaproteobacteria bacterium]|nr:SDR family NAD(P)-dependent oxidoreductase [Deltaproteobacteria bacterium]